MELLQNNFQNFHKSIIINPIHKKILFALKYYLARTCNTVRCPEIIQLNHYVDEFYASRKSSTKKIVLSPSQVPFPIAYFVNYSLIKKDESKFFYVDKEGNIQTHPYEHIIPVFVGLFADCNSSINSDYKGNLLIASILLSGEISVKLSQATTTTTTIVNVYDATCLAVVFVIGIVWKLSRETIAHVFDDILSTDNIVDMQNCLQHVSVATCSPSWFLDRYVASKRTDSLLDSIIEITASIKQEFPGLEIMQFCLMDFNPLASVLAATLYNDCLNPLTISINKNMFGTNIGQFPEEDLITKIQEQLARFIRWNQSNDDTSYQQMKWPLPEDYKNSVNIKLIDTDDDGTNITISQNTKPDKVFTTSKALSMLSNLDQLKLLGVEMSFHWVLGVAATQIIFENIDNFITNQSFVADALSLVFERAALD